MVSDGLVHWYVAIVKQDIMEAGMCGRGGCLLQSSHEAQKKDRNMLQDKINSPRT